MILAAGKGERMGTLTEKCPKPLLSVKGQPLITYHLKKLAAIGIKDCMINLRYLAEKIPQALGNGKQFGLNIHYSYEEEALETAGGIIQTLNFFDNQPFILISSDILTDYPFEKLLHHHFQSANVLAHVVMRDNPPHHPTGDFAIDENNFLSFEGNKLNYAGMGIYHPKLFESYSAGYRKLGDVMKDAITRQQITGEYYSGSWLNVDTPERLTLANERD